MIERNEIELSGENVVGTVTDIQRTLTIPLALENKKKIDFEITIEYSETDEEIREFLGYKISGKMNRFSYAEGEACNVEDDIQDSIEKWFSSHIPSANEDDIDAVVDIVWENLADLNLV